MTQSTELYWQAQGEGPDLVLLHGWGMNGAVWQNCIDQLAQHFRVHCVDLPGYGFSHQVDCDSMEALTDRLLKQAPSQAIWLGWSLGGLIATRIAQQAPQRVTRLVTLASSPKFSEGEQWRGIKKQVLANFTQQLVEDFSLTIERFMALQAMGSPSARQDIKCLKQAVLSRPAPNFSALALGLKWLDEMDLRPALSQLTVPVHRWYGRLDGLVPVKITQTLQQTTQGHDSFIFQQSSHAPFITEQEGFISQVIRLLDA
ncbi:pimeloyl-ACP methyl ester esterase BioH [Vibrio hippocampi]|uniref:Pimeloyl-[acyl-carrier protein] methyl ester esterase n=1 Tax=Vibrio hippocampi TaxID=654686 RepID=A0ABN8DCT1_9VIBR|nr:pimeloyl-ACP methyl ester esterase BioH [Vibrio hippocampi]CAH0524383.1 Pimeloyl-[acyl-carrier protein] methyl ester esterase [Vibrio hippocampi]